ATQTGQDNPGLLAQLALRYRLPTIFGVRDNVVAGGLMSCAPDHLDLTRRAAVYIDKILKGAKPAELPVEQASRYQLVSNLKTARAMGLTMPQSMRARREEVLKSPVLGISELFLRAARCLQTCSIPVVEHSVYTVC